MRRDTSPPPPSPALSVDAPISGGGWGQGGGGGGGGSGYAASAMRILTRRPPERAVLVLNDDLETRKEQGLKREETRAHTLQAHTLQESTSPSLLPVERMKHLLSAVQSRLNPPPPSLAAAVGVGGDAVACGEAEAGGVVGCEALESDWTATLGQKQIVAKSLFGAQPPTL